MKVKIFQLEKNVDVYIIDEANFKFDFLIGLDLIKIFRLIQNENLIISQKNNVDKISPQLNSELPDSKTYGNSKKEYKINFNEHVYDFNMTVTHLKEDQKKKLIS